MAGSPDPRRQHLARHLHRLGPRPVLEALQEVANGQPLDDVLTDYSRLEPDIVRVVGGTEFPPLPVEVVR